MVRTRNLEQFHRYVIDLWKYLKQVFKNDPKIKSLLNKAYHKHHQMDQVQYLEYILNNLTPYIDYITRRDEFIFTPEFGKKPLKFLIGIDFRNIWKPELTWEEKKVIFRYLEFLYMQASRAMGTNENKIKEIKEAIIMEQEIEKEAAENPNMFADQDGGAGGLGGLGDLASLFDGDNILMELAQELKEEINLEELLGEMLGGGGLQAGANPMDLMKNLSENKNMQNMLQNLQEKVSAKMQQRNISQDDLLASADKLRNGLMKNVSSMPGGSQIKKMIKNMDFEKMTSNFASMEQEPTPEQFLKQMMDGTSENNEPVAPFTMPPEFQQFLEQMQQPTNTSSDSSNIQDFLSQMQMPTIETSPKSIEEKTKIDDIPKEPTAIIDNIQEDHPKLDIESS